MELNSHGGMIYLASFKPINYNIYHRHIFYDIENICSDSNNYLYAYITSHGNEKHTSFCGVFGIYDYHTNRCIVWDATFREATPQIIPKKRRYIKLHEELNDIITNIIFDKL
jgi:hypothetical protein